MLIFPPHQRQGHGRRLLTVIYDDLKTNSNIQDIIGLKFDIKLFILFI